MTRTDALDAAAQADVSELRSAGLRVTAVRTSVLRALSHNPHSNAEDVLTFVRSDIGSVSVQAVYDVLHALTGAGLVQCIEPAGHPARYERRTGDNHHHLVCRGCGTVVDIDCATGQAPCLTPQNDHNFAIESAEVIYWGTCKSCEAQPD